MAESYEIESQREITDVNPDTGDLLDYWEVHAKTKPHGYSFSVRIPVAGADPGDVSAKLAARAAQFEAVERA